jgi:hypothetical protein
MASRAPRSPATAGTREISSVESGQTDEAGAAGGGGGGCDGRRRAVFAGPPSRPPSASSRATRAGNRLVCAFGYAVAVGVRSASLPGRRHRSTLTASGGNRQLNRRLLPDRDHARVCIRLLAPIRQQKRALRVGRCRSLRGPRVRPPATHSAEARLRVRRLDPDRFGACRGRTRPRPRDRRPCARVQAIPRSQAGRRREQHHRAVVGTESASQRVQFFQRLEWPLLSETRRCGFSTSSLVGWTISRHAGAVTVLRATPHRAPAEPRPPRCAGSRTLPRSGA